MIFADHQPQIFKEIEAGNIEAVRAYVENGHDINIQCNEDHDRRVVGRLNMLQAAASCNQVDILKLLIEHGMDPSEHETSGNGNIALTSAACHGSYDAFRFLCELRDDQGQLVIDFKRNSDLSNVVFIASDNDYKDILRYLHDLFNENWVVFNWLRGTHKLAMQISDIKKHQSLAPHMPGIFFSLAGAMPHIDMRFVAHEVLKHMDGFSPEDATKILKTVNGGRDRIRQAILENKN